MTNLEYLIKKFPEAMASAVSLSVSEPICRLQNIDCLQCPFNKGSIDCEDPQLNIYYFLLAEKDEESQDNETV